MNAASLAVFRVIFGLAVVVGVVRYVAYGWVETLYIEPAYHFTYWGFDWVAPWPGEWMYVHYAAMGVLGVLIAVGLFYRASISLFFVLFTYAELIDKTAYLNHYYLVSLLALLMIFMPLERTWSLDARINPDIASDTAPGWALWTLRLQLGLVYLFAGVAKLDADWLVDGQPLGIWLATKTDTPIVGALFDQAWVAHAMSIGGCVFDVSVFFLLLWPTSRVFAYVAVVVFHAATGLLFNIGLFPLIMIGLTPIFFEPDWPRRLFGSTRAGSPGSDDAGSPGSDAEATANLRSQGFQPWNKNATIAGRRRIIVCALAAYFAVQLIVPLRHLAYPGDVLWNQEGWRFSWRVMLAEKSGHLKYEVRDPDSGKRWVEYPSQYLTPRQLQLASASPDMILQLAHDIAKKYRKKGYANVEVYAHAYASVNARPSARLADPGVDLAQEERGLVHFDWVTPIQNNVRSSVATQL